MEEELKMNDDYVKICEQVYRGDIGNLWTYTVYNVDGSFQEVGLKTLNTPKRVCRDMATVMIGENIFLKNEELKEIFNEGFFTKFKSFLEKYLATGQGIILPYIVDGKLKFNFFTGTEFKVLNFSYGEPTEILVKQNSYNIRIKKNKQLISVEYEGKLNLDTSKTPVLVGDIPKEDVPLPASYSFEGELNYFKPNIANPYDENKGISIFYCALDIIRQLDVLFTDFESEFELSKKRVLIDSKYLKTEFIDVNGNTSIKTFDPKNTLYQMIHGVDGAPQIPITFIEGNIRVEAYINGITSMLLQLGQSVGLDDYYLLENGVIKTKAEVIDNKQSLYINREDHLNLMRSELKKLIKSSINLFNLMNKKNKLVLKEDIVIKVDDSIITDEMNDRKVALQEVKMGLRSKESYMKEFRNLNEKEIKEEMSLTKNIEAKEYVSDKEIGFNTSKITNLG